MSASLPLIVVVDDSLVVRAMLARQLDDHGYQVIEATDGESALTTCAAQLPDAVLLDLNLPGISGYEVLAALRADPETADIPVIILTERQSAEDAARGLELGAHDYLRKPIYPVELIARVDAALRLRNAEAVLRKRNTQLELANRTDFLSGLANRRHMDELLGRACIGARRDKRPLGLLILDVDHFKDINDMAGHVAGDAVLREIGRRTSAVMRAEDTAGRWGGDEFLFLMPNTNAPQLALAGERLRLAASHVGSGHRDRPRFGRDGDGRGRRLRGRRRGRLRPRRRCRACTRRRTAAATRWSSPIATAPQSSTDRTPTALHRPPPLPPHAA